MFIKRAKLLTFREGNYTTYAFKDLDSKEFIMCTKLPNWKSPNISIGDEGYLHYKIVSAGEEYYNIQTDNMSKYLYSNIYFIDFILDNKIIHNNEIIM